VTIVDPSQEEETLAECTFSIVYNTLGQLCTVYKPGGQVIPPTILQECMQISKKRAQTLVKQINFN
jgi:exosome complex RNA-binding protein Rrp42 (RNase PH superfamily)